ncbi:MAG: WD40/YVTN/BNR-like repeat-containing protein [Gemmatimonadaceae bacterium]
MLSRLASLALIALTAPLGLAAQGVPSQTTPTPTVNAADDPLLRGFRWRSIGPTGQGGRVNDIAVVEGNPSTYYVGFATGGLWKTTNLGTTFEPIFDTYTTHSIGDIAIAPSNPDIVYVGTGEPNNRQSSSFGDGMYKTTDGGKTFRQVGLRETQSIARILVHPRDPNTVWVAANGHLFGPNPERGVFKSSDGGATWNKVLYVDENTGATDLIIHPRDPNTLFAATYTRRRTSWGFAAGGPGDGIWKSTNGGQTWTRVSGGGLPRGVMGRIALDWSRSNPNVIYAQIEVGPSGEPIGAGARAGQPQGGGGGGGGAGGGGFDQQNLPPDENVSGIWRSSDGGRSWQFRSNENQRPMYFSQIRVDPNDENTVYVGGVQAAKSTDGAAKFTQLTGYGHVDHHAIWIDPGNSRHVMYGNDGSVDVSWDGAQTWESIRHWAVGQPYHASVDMKRPYTVCTGLQDNGSWCGPSSVRSGPILGQDWFRVGGGDGFYSQVDPTDPNIMYTESQNGNINRLDLRTGTSTSIRPRAPQRGPDGGTNFGGGAGGPNVFPTPEPGTVLRWNWNTPIQISPHDASTVITGANRLFVSKDRGETWWMSAELTKGANRDDREILGLKGSLPSCNRQRAGLCINAKNDGVSFYGTIIAVGQSHISADVIWVGTDDGNIQVTRDGGKTFAEVGKNIPGGSREYYISRVEPSYFDLGTAYVSLDGHRHDDLKPYVYVTRDFGATWSPIIGNLPAFGNVNSIRQDPRNKDLLYAATEFGFFTSLDEGKTWSKFMTNLPVVRIDDVIVHPRDNDLVLSTHGRSVWIMDDISALQLMTPAVLQENVVLFEPRNAVAWKQDIRLRRSVTGQKNFQGENAPAGTAISYYLKNPAPGDVKVTIRDLGNGGFVRSIDGTKTAGLNRVQWNLCSDLRQVQQGQGGGFGGGGGGGNPCTQGGFGGGGGGQAGQGGPRVGRLAAPGAYLVTLTVDGKEYTKTVTVLDDVWMN